MFLFLVAGLCEAGLTEASYSKAGLTEASYSERGHQIRNTERGIALDPRSHAELGNKIIM